VVSAGGVAGAMLLSLGAASVEGAGVAGAGSVLGAVIGVVSVLGAGTGVVSLGAGAVTAGELLVSTEPEGAEPELAEKTRYPMASNARTTIMPMNHAVPLPSRV